jgi:chemotaxis protein methyltransferase CheR
MEYLKPAPDAGALPAGEVLALSETEFAKISKLAYEHFGLDLGAGKQGLVSARLGKTIRQLGLGSFQAYYDHVLSDPSGEALASMVDDLTTNHTGFFREPRHFDFLRKTIVPRLRGRKTIAVWCAACSTGEEAYSIAISLAEELTGGSEPEVRILASDISTRVLAKAKRAIYPAERFRGLGPTLLPRYLLRSIGPGEVAYRIKPELRARVEFLNLNLMEDFSSLPLFPVIFCRNILIYFDKPTQRGLVQRLTTHLEPGGYLLIGHSENLNTIEHGLDYVEPATYRKPMSGNGSRKVAR